MKETLRISLIQTDLFWEDRDQNIQHLTNKIAQLDKNTDIIVLPETFTTGFSMKKEMAETGSSTVNWMKEMARSANAAIAGSLFVNEDGKCYNRLHFITPEGEVTIYNKKHLFSLTHENTFFTAGDRQVVVDYKGWKISLMVCFDLRFPVWMRRSEKHNYDMILVVANWPERRSYAWNQLLIARAIENQAYVVAVNRIGTDGTGILYGGESGVIDPMGQHIAKGNPFADQYVQATIEYSRVQSIRKALPFFNDGDRFTI